MDEARENDETLLIRLPKELKEDFMKVCKNRDQNVSQVIRAFIRSEVGRMEYKLDIKAEHSSDAQDRTVDSLLNDIGNLAAELNGQIISERAKTWDPRTNTHSLYQSIRLQGDRFRIEKAVVGLKAKYSSVSISTTLVVTGYGDSAKVVPMIANQNPQAAPSPWFQRG